MRSDISTRMACAFPTAHACYLPTEDAAGVRPVQVGDCLEAAAEITRLRSWISYIDGNFSGSREAAHDALSGLPAPEGF